jgi:hypothetical protein
VYKAPRAGAVLMLLSLECMQCAREALRARTQARATLPTQSATPRARDVQEFGEQYDKLKERIEETADIVDPFGERSGKFHDEEATIMLPMLAQARRRRFCFRLRSQTSSLSC